MPIIPDTKNWTWVLDRPCGECGFDAATIAPTAVAAIARANAAAWPAVLAAPGVALRPDENTWSSLEYAAHVRDVFRIFQVRLGLMLTETDPLFPNWDQDETAIAQNYGGQDPATVSHELVAAGTAFADDLDAVPHGAWSRTGHRSDGASFTVATLATYFLHDVVHHLHDVGAAAD